MAEAEQEEESMSPAPGIQEDQELGCRDQQQQKSKLCSETPSASDCPESVTRTYLYE